MDSLVASPNEPDHGDIEAYLQSRNPKFFAIFGKARAEAQEKGWLTTEQLKASLGLE